MLVLVNSYILLISIYLACKVKKEEKTMSEIKNLCAKIPALLHTKVRTSQEESNLTLNQYMEQLLTEYYQMKEGKDMSQTKTLAIQIPEEMSIRIKEHIAKTPKLTLKGFLISIIEQALTDSESADEIPTETDADETTSVEPNTEEHPPEQTENE